MCLNIKICKCLVTNYKTNMNNFHPLEVVGRGSKGPELHIISPRVPILFSLPHNFALEELRYIISILAAMHSLQI